MARASISLYPLVGVLKSVGEMKSIILTSSLTFTTYQTAMCLPIINGIGLVDEASL